MADLTEVLGNVHQLAEPVEPLLQATRDHLEMSVQQMRSLQASGASIAPAQLQSVADAMDQALAGVSHALEACRRDQQEPEQMSDSTTGDPSNPIQNPAMPNPECDPMPEQTETGDSSNPIQNPPPPNPPEPENMP